MRCRSRHITTLPAIKDCAVIALETIVRQALSWSPHVDELRVMVQAPSRSKGLRQRLTQECFALAFGTDMEKMTAQVTVDQRGAITGFEWFGFRAEALLRDHVKDGPGPP